MNKMVKLNLRYRTEPELISRVLPPPLEPDDEAIVFVDYALLEYEEDFRNIFIPGPYYESGFHVSAKYKGKRGVFQVGMPLNHDWGRSMGRELVGYHKKDGAVNIEVEGNTVKASLKRRGALIHKTETVYTENTAHPITWFREFGYGAFFYRFRLNPNWRQGPFSDTPVELWRLGGNDLGYPVNEMKGENLPLVCDIKHTEFSFINPSLLDPFCEFIPLELLSVTYHTVSWEGLIPPQLPVRPGSKEEGVFGPNSTFLETIDKNIFKFWAIIGHDRPITNSKPWCPIGWPDKTTALKLTSGELHDYRSREALSLNPITVFDIEMKIPKKDYSRLFPQECKESKSSSLRILGIKVEKSDLSTMPFNELWLCSECVIKGKIVYYLLSHIVSSNGDVIYGRETFGYPSKMGSVKLEFNSNNAVLHGKRLDRDFFHCTASSLSAEINSKKETEFEVIGIRMQPFRERQVPVAELSIQKWRFYYEKIYTCDTDNVNIDFPDTPAPGLIGHPDPWFDFKKCSVTRFSIYKGGLHRKPVSSLIKLKKPLPYIIERYDSVFDTEMDKLINMIVGGTKNSFIV